MAECSPIDVVEDIRFRGHRSHETHPECPERLRAVSRALRAESTRWRPLAPRAADPEELLRVHTTEHLRRIERAVARAPAQLDADTYVARDSAEVAYLAAGSGVDLARRVARGEARSGFAALRPPGHHAEPDRAMGFCLLNNAAIAARSLQAKEGLERILIVDWDVHHGNGTQRAFENEAGVLYFSTHQFPYYPGSGEFGEIGCGAGLGHTLNVPLPAGCGDAEYVGVFERVLAPVARSYEPQLILVSCGFDAHRDDPLAAMRVSEEGFLALARLVCTLARDLCDGRLVFLLEGGYSASGLEQGTRAVLRALLEQPTRGQRPAPAGIETPPGSTLRSVLTRVSASQATIWPCLATPF